MSQGHVYFIECGEGGPVKIGFAGSMEKRLNGLQTANPEQLNLLAAIWATDDYELELHRRFASGRIRGEWFRRDTPGLADAIDQAVLLSKIAADRGLLLTHGVRPRPHPTPDLREAPLQDEVASA